jgi:hypothetical protein
MILLMIIGADIVVAIKLFTARFRIKYIPVILNFLYLKGRYDYTSCCILVSLVSLEH